MKIYAILENTIPDIVGYEGQEEYTISELYYTPLVCDSFVELKITLNHLNRLIGEEREFYVHDFTIEPDEESYSDVCDWRRSAESFFKSQSDSYFEKPLGVTQFDAKRNIISLIENNKKLVRPTDKYLPDFDLEKEFSPVIISAYYDVYYKGSQYSSIRSNSLVPNEIDRFYLYVLIEDLYNEERNKRQQKEK